MIRRSEDRIGTHWSRTPGLGRREQAGNSGIKASAAPAVLVDVDTRRELDKWQPSALLPEQVPIIIRARGVRRRITFFRGCHGLF